MRGELEFRVYSGGKVVIDLDRCIGCESKACIQVCQIQGGPLQLDAALGTPVLNSSKAEIEKGKCIECLGCELECELSGMEALHFSLPIAGFTEYLAMQTQLACYQR